MDLEGSLSDKEKPQSPVSYALRLGDGLEFAEFEPSHWRLTVYHVLGVSRQISLGYAEAFLLEYFARHPGEMISREHLISHAWGDRVVSQGSLNQAVSNIRALLGDDQKREIIITVPRRGYQLSADALMEWEHWLERKQQIISPAPSNVTPCADVGGAEDAAPLVSPVDIPVKASRWCDWTLTFLRVTIAILFVSLVAGLLSRFYYDLWPPYVLERSQASNMQLTVVARDDDDLAETKEYIAPIVRRLSVIANGKVLINRMHNQVELNCLRADGTIFTLFFHVRLIHQLDDVYLMRCVK
ncbi:winged helix-turn-helix domain-containing protein [Pseudomonas atacamensis]|uniref:winged helix-turn-helix domain-containing protein n=1 Tax=Pseudomonas atacamensis TaxID=2565368 RepID=UPI001C3C74DD|nr:winged helix-turn-helix domain-containing protein [Pseudomonas atacamensis]QXH74831.1 winged helix-turn-helix domain-containing protein [Pseudomonas atacamensis]